MQIVEDTEQEILAKPEEGDNPKITASVSPEINPDQVIDEPAQIPQVSKVEESKGEEKLGKDEGKIPTPAPQMESSNGAAATPQVTEETPQLLEPR